MTHRGTVKIRVICIATVVISLFTFQGGFALISQRSMSPYNMGQHAFDNYNQNFIERGLGFNPMGSPELSAPSSPMLGMLILMMALAQLFYAYGLWTEKKWGYVLALATNGVFVLLLFSSMVSGVGFAASLVGIVIAGAFIWQLLQRDVMAVYREKKVQTTVQMGDIPPSTPYRGCPHCGHEVSASARFCGECGNPLT